MTIFDPTVTMMEKALDVISIRHQATAQNIANINTPGYKRTEVAFPTVLADIMKDYRSSRDEQIATAQAIENGTMSPMEASFIKADMAFGNNFQEPQAAGGGPLASTISCSRRAWATRPSQYRTSWFVRRPRARSFARRSGLREPCGTNRTRRASCRQPSEGCLL